MKTIYQYKKYIYIFAIAIICMLVASAGTIFVAIYKIQYAKDYAKLASQVAINIHEANNTIKKYLLNVYIDHQNEGKNNIIESKQIIYETKKILETNQNKNIYNNNILLKQLDSIENVLQNIYVLQTKRGFKDTGLEGEMRNAIHLLENKLDANTMILLLTIRKHEKDFFIRKDASYLEKHALIYKQIKANIAANNKPELLPLIEKYEACFLEIVAIETQMGLSQNLGNIGKLASCFAIIDEQTGILTQKAEMLSGQSKYIMTFIILVLCALITVLIAATFVFIKFFNSQIITPISNIQTISENLASGKLNITCIKNKNNGILNQTLDNFSLIIENYLQTFSTIQSILKFDEKLVLIPKNTQDEATNKLIGMREFVFKKNKQDLQREYLDNGTKHISMLLYQKIEMSEISENITTYLVKHLKANQASFFLQSKENPSDYNLVACYAYNRKKYETKTISLGEGLLGQCAYEKETIMVTDLPQNYTKITSGLGETTPNCLVIVPFINDGKVIAIFEICSFNFVQKEEIEFLENCGKLIASAITYNQLLHKTQTLLKDSETYIDTLNQKNIESENIHLQLKYTEEDRNRKNIELQLEIDNLNLELEKYNLEKTKKETSFSKEKLVFVSKINELNRKLNAIVAIKKETQLQDFVPKEITEQKPKYYSRQIEYFLDN